MEIMGLIKVLEKFRGKKVLITGHTGFKGSWLSYLLDNHGAITLGYSLKPNTEPSLYEELEFSENHKSVISDINDFEKIKNVVNQFKPEFIFHLAAQPLVLESYENPKYTFETNFNGTLNLLEVIRIANLKTTAILITTDKVYENDDENTAFSENDRIGGKDPYSSSKAVCELLINSYQHSFFKASETKVASARAGNVIGGGDWSNDRLIPDIIRFLFENKSIEIRNPLSTRPWQHVLEPLHGYLLLALKLNEKPNLFSGAWNFGPSEGDIKSVQEIIEIIKNQGFKKEFNYGDKLKFKEAKYLALKIEKAKTILDWKPKWNSETSIEKTLNWYKGYYNGTGVSQLIETDIKNYIK